MKSKIWLMSLSHWCHFYPRTERSICTAEKHVEIRSLCCHPILSLFFRWFDEIKTHFKNFWLIFNFKARLIDHNHTHTLKSPCPENLSHVEQALVQLHFLLLVIVSYFTIAYFPRSSVLPICFLVSVGAVMTLQINLGMDITCCCYLWRNTVPFPS